MGNVSIDLSLENIWKSWFQFRRGKRKTKELDQFQYFLENNIYCLWQDLNSGTYCHGGYARFVANDNKRREISVAGIRDRVVHRLVYGYLVKIYDQDFISDVWSCRKGKGLLGAIERTEEFLKKYSQSFVWRSDARKFFDSVDHGILKKIIACKIVDPSALLIIGQIIDSYFVLFRKDDPLGKIGIPIGNLTSQIFANIYLNELDQFVENNIKPLAYLRYGDDFLVFDENWEDLGQKKKVVVKFLTNQLGLQINSKNDIIVKARWGLRFLGAVIFSKGRKLKKRNWKRAVARLERGNISSYRGLIVKHSNGKRIKYFDWKIMETLEL